MKRGRLRYFSRIEASSAVHSLAPILGTLTVDGQAGSDRLNLNDQGSFYGIAYTVTSTAVSSMPKTSISITHPSATFPFRSVGVPSATIRPFVITAIRSQS